MTTFMKRGRAISAHPAARRGVALLAVAALDGSGCGWGGGREQVGHGHPQRIRQRTDHGQRGVGVAGLDAAHIGPEQAAVGSQVFLGQLPLQAQLPHAGTEHRLGVGCGARCRLSTRLGLGRGLRHPGRVSKVHSFKHTLIRTWSVGRLSLLPAAAVRSRRIHEFCS